MNFTKFKPKAFKIPVAPLTETPQYVEAPTKEDDPLKPVEVPLPVVTRAGAPRLMCDRHVEHWERLPLWAPEEGAAEAAAAVHSTALESHRKALAEHATLLSAFEAAVAAHAAAVAAGVSEPGAPPPAAPPPPPPPPPPLDAPPEPVEVPEVVCKWLRPHQREGVQFMFECVTGLRDFDGQGCILADDMGLGKSLQAIALLYTLMKGMPNRGRKLRRAIIVCPTSLVANWRNELEKWLGHRCRVVALTEGGAASLKGVKAFLRDFRHHALVVSYETFRKYVDKFRGDDACDLLVCDEAHRLKNNATQTSRALASLACRRRVLLTGTPMQNDLEEFFAMVDFTNPGLLGSAERFRRYYQRPILDGREPGCCEADERLGRSRAVELQRLVDCFICRRTNDLLAAHLPTKVVQVVCIRMTPLQHSVYEHFLSSKAAAQLLDAAVDGSATVRSRPSRGPRGSHGHPRRAAASLSSITALKKLCNHPTLIHDQIRAARGGGGGRAASAETRGAAGFEDCEHLFPECYRAGGSRAGRAGRRRGGGSSSRAELSGKFAVTRRMLSLLRQETTDRVVIVSNYTQTLELLGAMCRENGWPHVRLDGSTATKKRQRLVDRFCDPDDDLFVFLLSSKAGGCGLNLIGGNRLILFDPDWNPANDKQAAARVWREGQRKRTYLYRFLATGTIEEKIYQRQISKEGLQNVVVDKKADGNFLRAAELRDIFSLRCDTISDTHDKLRCERCRGREGCAPARRAEGSSGVSRPGQEPSAVARSAAEAAAVSGAVPEEAKVGAETVDGAATEAISGKDGKDGHRGAGKCAKDAEGGSDKNKRPRTREGGRRCIVAEHGAKSREKENSDPARDVDEALSTACCDEATHWGRPNYPGGRAEISSSEACIGGGEGAAADGAGSKRKRGIGSGHDQAVESTQQVEIVPGVAPAEDDLVRWGHHTSVDTLQDDILKRASQGMVSFVFELEIKSDMPEASSAKPTKAELRAAARAKAAAKAAARRRRRPGSSKIVLPAGNGAKRRTGMRRRLPPRRSSKPLGQPSSAPAPTTASAYVHAPAPSAGILRRTSRAPVVALDHVARASSLVSMIDDPFGENGGDDDSY
jgi:DNA repair and recombination RAD54-like protein